MRRACLAAACSLALVTGTVAVQASPIYACVDANGKHITSDRPIAECLSREHRVLNPDGSTREIRSPAPTADEQAELEARERARAVRAAIEADAVRSDRNLRSRYPNEAAHQRARAAALDDVRRTLQLSQRRLDALAAERRPLQDEAEFYAGRQMPPLLKQQLDGNESAADAQRTLMANQEAETLRINAAFDVELARLRAVWAGAAPGSLGPMPKASGVSTPSRGTAAPASAKPKP
ncbi:MAG: hypothetical protein B7Y51_04895 [Burkholderiales bacterium 28-67-8]|nr:MAG: hypothetical protein B7Y51_04895 [Burkholderiales bacterium 28-67-8]